MSNMITIDKRFEKSVNLFFDLGKKDKIDSYISTSASDRILKQYMDSLKKGNKGRVSMLIGPYGKGKSHLLLVLLYKLEHMEKPYLPVLISYGQQDLKEEFLVGLQRALQRAGIKDIQPDSYYTEAIRQIELWKEKYTDTYRNMEKQLSTYNINGKELEKQLKQYSKKALKIFRKIYPELTSGGVFEPLIRTDLKENIVSINEQLSRKYGYRGMFVVFDEFGKYIEGHNLQGYENDMKVLQDMCELGVKTDEPQFHLTMVTHKSIKEYGNTVDKRIMDGFMGIEGRIREIYYVDSVQNHYEMIASVLKKDKNLFRQEVIENDNSGYTLNLKNGYKNAYFRSIFSEKEFEKIVCQGCYPLTTVAAYLLLHISWKMAQNERTIFTFLAGQDVNGLPALIKKYGEKHYFGGEVIYDYFENTFREEVKNTQVHGEWLKADYVLEQVTTEEEKSFIKNLALLEMVHKENEMPVTEENIALALGISLEKCEKIRKILEKKQFLVYRKATNHCRLKNNIGVNLEEEMKRVIASSKTDIRNVLSKVAEMQYELPKRYNLHFKMTRFFEYEFFHSTELLELKTFKYLFDDRFSDGKIILLLEHTDSDSVEEFVQKLQDERVIIMNPHKDFSGGNLVEQYEAIKKLKKNQEFLDENKAIITELEIYRQDLYFEINSMLEDVYRIENKNCELHGICVEGQVNSRQHFNRLLSDICDQYYHKAPRVNHELINRNNLSAQIRKARNKLMSEILEHKDMSIYLKGTSAEATIYRAAFMRAGDESGIPYTVNIIKDFVYASAGKMNEFSELYDILQGKNLGIRKGIISLYIAKVLSELSDLPVIYCQNKEVALTSEILANIDLRPVDYSLYVEKSTVEKEKYLKSLEKLYSVEDGNQNLEKIVDGMLGWYRALPRYSASYQKGLDNEQIRFRELLRGQDKNPRNLLFKNLPDLFKTEDFEELFLKIKTCKEKVDAHMNKVYAELGIEVRKNLGGNETDDLYNLLKQWSRKHKNYMENHVCTSEFVRFYQFIENLEGYEDAVILSDMSKVLTDTFPDNWSDGSQEHFLKCLEMVLQETNQKNDEEDNRKVRFVASDGEIIEKSYSEAEADGTGIFLQNAIEDALEEFDGSIDNSQKVAILVQALEKVIRNG